MTEYTKGLDGFLSALVEQTHNGAKQYLARTMLGFGGARAFGQLELRSYWKDGGPQVPEVLERSYAARAQFLNDRPQDYGNATGHMPELYRIPVRPRDFGPNPAMELQLWHPGHPQPHANSIELLPSDIAQDVLATPVTPIAEVEAPSNVAIPPLRIAGGAVDGQLQVSVNTDQASHFRLHMALDTAKKTIFDLFGIHLTEEGHWPVRATAEGLEFDVTLPDPTRGYGGNGTDTDRIAARVRLETLPRRGGTGREGEGPDPDCPYILRLIGPVLDLSQDDNSPTLNDLSDRLSNAAGSLIEATNPARLRIDTLGLMPPLFWPLRFVTAGGHSTLRYVPVPFAEDEAVMQIDTKALDLRLSTRSTHPDAETGLARIHLDEAAWLRGSGNFKMAFRAGHPPGDVAHNPSGNSKYALSYKFEDEKWRASLIGEITEQPVHLPQDAMRARLTSLYRAANVILDTDEAPYAFLAVRDGWMQMPLGLTSPPPSQSPSEEGTRAMTGRIVFFPSEDSTGTELAKGLSIDDARRMSVDITWTGPNTRPAQIDVRPEGEAGQFLGFVYAADTSPNAQDAIPVWTAGDVTTREVPLWFGGPHDTIARLTWTREDTEKWSLVLDHNLDWPEKDTHDWLAWLTPGPYPFVTNYPMARTALGARVPSATRGMVPYAVTSGPELTYEATGDSIDDGLPALKGAGGTVLTGEPYAPTDALTGTAPMVRSLLLPTLNGTEIHVPADTDATDWTFQMRLRHDLPLLDELFAWSDPPPAEPVERLTGPGLPKTTDAQERPIPPVVTALDPARLAEIWRANEHRMELTWTQDAVANDALLPTDGTVQFAEFKKIAAPFSFRTNVQVTLSPDHLFGDLSFPDLPDQPSGLAGALVGLGGRLTADDAPLSLVLKDGALHVPEGADNTNVTVTGYAADHYTDPDTGHLADNRGSAMAPDPHPETPGLRDTSIRSAPDNEPAKSVLLTTPAEQEVTTDQIQFAFSARDLPVQWDGTARRFLFHGVSSSDLSHNDPNPIEGKRSFDGDAFDADTMLHGLYEWRCYGPTGESGLLGEFEIETEDGFSFRPLRLILAEFDEGQAPTKLWILGSLTLKPTATDAGKYFAFGPDRVYDRDDLFVLKANLGTDGWTTELKAYDATSSSSSAITLNPATTPALTLSRRLTSAGDSQYPFDDAIQAQIELPFDPDATWPEIRTARLTANLFGGNLTLDNGTIVPETDDITLRFNVPAPATSGPLQLQDVQLEVSLTANATRDTLKMTGTLRLCADPDDADGTALLNVETGTWSWLDLSFPDKGTLTTQIDHEEGALTLNIAPLDLDAGASPLFGLTYPDGAQPEVTGSLAAVFVPGTTQIATAMCHIDLHPKRLDYTTDTNAPDYLLQHTFSKSSQTDHALALTWTTPKTASPIRWPVGQDEVALVGGDRLQTLEEIAKGPLQPSPNVANGGEQNRLLRIAPEGETLNHYVALTLKAHRIDASRLIGTGDGIEPAETLRMMAAAQHMLISDIDPHRNVDWWSLDHVAITSAAAIRAEVQRTAFAPRVSATTSGQTLRYRDAPVAQGLPVGMRPIGDANLSGFHDAGMVASLWENPAVSGAVILGCGAMRLPLPSTAIGQPPTRAHVVQLPWAMGLPDDTVLQMPTQQRTWRISTVDAWAAHAIELSTTRAAQGLNTGLAEDGIRQRLGAPVERGAPGDPTQLIPAEPAFFEGWDGNNPTDINNASHPHSEAPYFLRTMLALRARWRIFASQDSRQWNVQTLVPQPLRRDDPSSDPIPLTDSAATLLILELTKDLNAETKAEAAGSFPADMVALARNALTRIDGYRNIRAVAASGHLGSVMAELRDVAETLDQQARAALRLVRLQGGRIESLARILSRADDPLAQNGAVLVRPENGIGASPALGWPIATQSLATSLAASFGPDRAVQAPNPGLSGRGQSIAWPTHALDGEAPTDAIFASFGQHVVYERGQTPFAHDGPAARHLAPAPTRRRAPNPAQTHTILARPVTDPGDTHPPAPVEMLGTDCPTHALTPARINRLTIGRRPGAMEVSTTSLTLAGQTDGMPVLLDAGWPGMGRAADSTPVLSHALRTPRSPVLPPDPKPSQLDQRRRTYLSRADVTGTDDEPELLPFDTFDDPRDVIRIAEDGGTFWRIDAGGDGGAAALRIGPAWLGSLRIRLSGYVPGSNPPRRQPANPSAVLGIKQGLIALLGIGGLVTQHAQIQMETEGDVVTLTLTFPNVDKLQERLAEATVDTPLSLTLKFPYAAGAEPMKDLDIAPAVAMDLPLTLDTGGRRVVRTRTRTIAFGDPAYDRVLASRAALVSDRDGDDEFRASADRREYNPDSTMLLAFGRIDPPEDMFDDAFTEEANVTFQRIPFEAPGTTEDLQLKLPSGDSKSEVSIKATDAVRLHLADLRNDSAPDDAALSAGDTLIIKLNVPDDVKLTLRVRIVAAPVIAPPASVYSVIETVGVTARTRLHAPGSLPTRIEFPDLIRDLARGHVRREALFVWHFATPAPINPEGNRDRRTDLIKLDRSGGGQLPSA